MEKIKYYLEKYKIIIILSVLTIIIILSILYTFLRPNKKEEIVETLEVKEIIKEEVKVEEKNKSRYKRICKKSWSI